MGDQAGVGPEIVERALNEGVWPDDVIFRIIGEKVPAVLGQPSRVTAQAALDALELGAELLRRGEIDGIVTAPVCKEALHDVGFLYPGQTEFFADRMGADSYAMCLTGEHLTVALVTIHVALADVPTLLTREEIVRIGGLLEEFCRRRGASMPRIAVCGLNPHAGENGSFGKEDIEIVAPAISALNAGREVSVFSGPYAADTIFRAAANGSYDAVLCMYHDQGLIPLKLLDFDTGVNTTLGLSRPRTSPDHGTAFDIAGQGVASAASMRHAIQLACELA